MDLQKEREAFEAVTSVYHCIYNADLNYYFSGSKFVGDKAEIEVNAGWKAWQARAQSVQGWISVEDELPKENQFCVTYFAPTESRLSTLAGHCEFGFGLSSFGCRKATHWMPLPDAPQEPAND